MSGNKKNLSKAEEELSKKDSVLEFLYHDSRRVGSFLSQFDPGLLQNLTRTNEASSQETEKTGREFALGAPSVFGGKNRADEEVGSGTRNTLQSVYDPYWSNALALLNYLEDRGLIQRDVTKAKLGSITLFTGSLSIIDLGMIRELWALPSIQRAIHGGGGTDEAAIGNRQGRRSQGKLPKPANDPNTQLLLEVLPTLPHSINAMIGGPAGQAWATLEDQHLVGSGSNLVLKHGSSIPGQWHMLCILDAVPDDGSLDGIAEGLGAVNAPVFASSLIGNVSNLMAPIIRFLMGRPVEAYGATPLMIFREVL